MNEPVIVWRSAGMVGAGLIGAGVAGGAVGGGAIVVVVDVVEVDDDVVVVALANGTHRLVRSTQLPMP